MEWLDKTMKKHVELKISKMMWPGMSFDLLGMTKYRAVAAPIVPGGAAVTSVDIPAPSRIPFSPP